MVLWAWRILYLGCLVKLLLFEGIAVSGLSERRVVHSVNDNLLLVVDLDRLCIHQIGSVLPPLPLGKL